MEWVRRPRGVRYDEKFIRKTKASGRVSVAVWGSFTSDGPQKLVRVNGKLTAKQYNMRILGRHVRPYFTEHPDAVFQQDNSPIHTAIACRNYLLRAGIPTLPWPAASPDLSPIENFWAEVKNEVGDVEHTAGSEEVRKDALWNQVEEAWEEIKATRGPELVATYYNSMPARLNAVIAAAGGPTRY